MSDKKRGGLDYTPRAFPGARAPDGPAPDLEARLAELGLVDRSEGNESQPSAKADASPGVSPGTKKRASLDYTPRAFPGARAPDGPAPGLEAQLAKMGLIAPDEPHSAKADVRHDAKRDTRYDASDAGSALPPSRKERPAAPVTAARPSSTPAPVVHRERAATPTPPSRQSAAMPTTPPPAAPYEWPAEPSPAPARASRPAPEQPHQTERAAPPPPQPTYIVQPFASTPQPVYVVQPPASVSAQAEAEPTPPTWTTARSLPKVPPEAVPRPLPTASAPVNRAASRDSNADAKPDAKPQARKTRNIERLKTLPEKEERVRVSVRLVASVDAKLNELAHLRGLDRNTAVSVAIVQDWVACFGLQARSERR